MAGRLLFILIFFLFLSGQSFAFWVWTPETNKWVNPKYAVKDTPKEQLAYALEFYQIKDYAKAINECLKLIQHYPQSREAAEAQYYIGRCQQDQDALYDAFKSYQKVLDKYPFSDRAVDIVEAQYHIAESMIEGKGARNKIIGAIVGGEYPVVEVLKAVIKNAPYGPYAPVAQYKIGLYLQEQGLFQDARDEFEKVIND
jgi:outer membrane protein assembly factor BamD